MTAELAIEPFRYGAPGAGPAQALLAAFTDCTWLKAGVTAWGEVLACAAGGLPPAGLASAAGVEVVEVVVVTTGTGMGMGSS